MVVKVVLRILNKIKNLVLVCNQPQFSIFLWKNQVAMKTTRLLFFSFMKTVGFLSFKKFGLGKIIRIDDFLILIKKNLVQWFSSSKFKKKH
jgi:hypothetical protein